MGHRTGRKALGRGGKISLGAAVGVAAMVCACMPAYAQTVPDAPLAEIFNAQVKPLVEVIQDEEGDSRPQTSQGAIQVMNWLVYGRIGVGSAYDSNLNGGSSNDAIGASGIRFLPTIVAVHDTGIQRTEIYGVGDIRYYPSENFTNAEGTRVGIMHLWQIQRDFTFRIQGEERFNSQISSLVNLNGSQIGVPDQPINYQTTYGSTSLEKGFGRFFVGLGGSVERQNYDDSQDSYGNKIDESFRDETTYTIANRVGYYVSPISYIFAEPELNYQRFANATDFNSDGQSIKIGIGTQRISLFSGEIYGGYYRQDFDAASLGVVDGPLFGGKISWIPTRFITVTAKLDHVFNTQDYSTGATPIGSITEDYLSELKASWSITEAVTLRGAVGYDHENYLSSPRLDKVTWESAGVTYYFRNNIGINVDYTHEDRNSNIEGAGYSRNFVSVGATRKF